MYKRQPEAQFEGDLGAVGPHHSIDLVGCDPGVGQGPEGANQGDGRRIVVRQDSGLLRVADTGDGDPAEGMGGVCRHGSTVSSRGGSGPGLRRGESPCTAHTLAPGRRVEGERLTILRGASRTSLRSRTGGAIGVVAALGGGEIVGRGLPDGASGMHRRVRSVVVACTVLALSLIHI